MIKHENPFSDLFDYTEQPFDLNAQIDEPAEDDFDESLKNTHKGLVKRARGAFNMFLIKEPDAVWEDCHWMSWHGHCTERRFLDDRGGLALKRGDQYIYTECTWLS